MTLDEDKVVKAANDILRYAMVLPQSSNLKGWSIGFKDTAHGFSIMIKDGTIVLDLELRENQQHLWYRKELDRRMRETIEQIASSFHGAGLHLCREGYRSNYGSWSVTWKLRRP